MTGHRMIGMAKECFAIFGGNAGRSQSTCERVPKIMNANQSQSHFAAGALPGVVVHGVDGRHRESSRRHAGSTMKAMPAAGRPLITVIKS
jgi:hypothetical protein